MVSEVRKKRIEEVYETPIVKQTAFWSEVKRRMGAEPLVCDFNVRADVLDVEAQNNLYAVSDVLVLLQRLNSSQSIAYVPYGPEIEPMEEVQGAFLEDLSESLRSHLPSGCLMIRYDLLWESLWAKDTDFFDENGSWLGPPSPESQETRFNFSTAEWRFRKAPTNLLPSNTIFVDLSLTEAQILARMKPKTRYNIGLSQRRGVHVRTAHIDELPVWYRLYAETAHRNRFYLHDLDYFKAVLTANVTGSTSSTQVYLLIAELDGLALAAMFLVLTGKRGTYLYGASSDLHRNSMPTYALQWEAMRLAKAAGCDSYDLFGVAPTADDAHPMSGLNRFKSGFGGSMHHSMGCWDYPLEADVYAYYRAVEMSQQGYHLSH